MDKSSLCHQDRTGLIFQVLTEKFKGGIIKCGETAVLVEVREKIGGLIGLGSVKTGNDERR